MDRGKVKCKYQTRLRGACWCQLASSPGHVHSDFLLCLWAISSDGLISRPRVSFQEPIKAMRSRVSELKRYRLQQQNVLDSTPAHNAHLIRLREGIIRGIDGEITEFESAIKHLESIERESHEKVL